jgi:hypothetical protein
VKSHQLARGSCTERVDNTQSRQSGNGMIYSLCMIYCNRTYDFICVFNEEVN